MPLTLTLKERVAFFLCLIYVSVDSRKYSESRLGEYITSTKQLFITCKLTDYKWFQQTIPYLLFLFCLYKPSTNHLSYLYNPENDRSSVCSQAWNVTFPARECRIPKLGTTFSLMESWLTLINNYFQTFFLSCRWLVDEQ